MKILRALACLAMLLSVLMSAAAAAIDRNTALSSTPYKAFTGTPASMFRNGTRIVAAATNTQPVYVLYLPAGTTAPASVASMQVVPECMVLQPGDQVNGGAGDTSYLTDIWVAAASGSQGVTFFEEVYPNLPPLSVVFRAGPANADVNLLNTLSLSPSSNYTSATFVNPGWKGATFYLVVSGLASGQSVQFRLNAIEPASGSALTKMQSIVLSANGSYDFVIYPGVGASGSANGTTVSSLSDLLPRSFQVQLIYGDTTGTKAVTVTLAYAGAV